jgi:hypothetical protein
MYVGVSISMLELLLTLILKRFMVLSLMPLSSTAFSFTLIIVFVPNSSKELY